MTDVEAPPPPAFKNRRGWLIAFGIAEILIGCLILLLMAATYFILRKVPATATAPPPDAGAMLIAGIIYGAIAVLFVVIGIGSIHARRWARLAMLIVSWAWLAMGVLTSIMLAFILPRIFAAQPDASAPNVAAAQHLGEIVMFVTLGLFFIVLPLVFIFFYSGKNVKATCELAAPVTHPSKPAVVLIASAWFAMGIFGYLFVFMRPALPWFGYVLHGWAAYTAAAAMEALTIWLAWNLYRQRELAWKITIAWLIIGWASMLITIARFGFLGMYGAMGYSEAELAPLATFTKVGLLFGCALGVLFLIFMLATRKYYRQPATAE